MRLSSLVYQREDPGYDLCKCADSNDPCLSRISILVGLRIFRYSLNSFIRLGKKLSELWRETNCGWNRRLVLLHDLGLSIRMNGRPGSG